MALFFVENKMPIMYAVIDFKAARFFVDNLIRCHVPETRRVMIISYGVTVHAIHVSDRLRVVLSQFRSLESFV